jgi:DNA-binding beta-propeller fold protein YncE
VPDVGTQLAGYRIDGVLGRGGMGVVYRATELALERPVALKLIAHELAGDASFRERFLRESRLAASIDHPGILPVYAAGDAEGELYLANRFVDGTDLRAVLEQGPLPPKRALALVGQIADALDAAHARGLVHRDVKPGNVLVDGADHCYLCDFGLTTRLGAGGNTASGRLAGSLDYLAPEQIRQGTVDGRTDQYALACVLHELLSGTPPFRRETEAQTLWAHMQEEPPTLAAYPQLDLVLARALAKEQDDRYETCDAFVDDARAALGLAPSPVAVRRRRRRLGRRLLASGAALLAVAVVATMLVLTLGSGETLVAPPNSVGVVDPASGGGGGGVGGGGGEKKAGGWNEGMWVLNSNDGAGTLSKIDAKTRTVTSTFSVPGTPRNLVSAFGSLWVGTVEGRVLRVDPETDLVERSWTLPNAGVSTPFEEDRGAGWLAAGPNPIRAGSVRAISRIDPASSRLLRRESTAWGPMAYGFGSIWIVGGEKIERVSAATMRRVATVRVTGFYVDVASGLGSIWLADDEGHAIVRVDPGQHAIARTYDLGGAPFGVAVGAGAVWATSDEGRVARIDAARDDVDLIGVGGAPRSLDVGGQTVWVSVD